MPVYVFIMMNYTETIKYLYNSAPLFQNVGGRAYKEGLDNTLTLDAHLGNPQNSFKSIHIAGTNGKGSCAHSIASVLQGFGLKVGLYTSPHLMDFRERIRINGKVIPKGYVIDFVEKLRPSFECLHPSFFEITTALAFKYFADEKVDVAIIEVGLGGRLDCTNVITPIMSIITNISLDHTQFLGETLDKIAVEKAGIIKHRVPVVIGESVEETKPIFELKAKKENASIIFAEEFPEVIQADIKDSVEINYESRSFGKIKSHLCGEYQLKNMNTILTALHLLFSEKLLAKLNDKVDSMKREECESIVRRGLEVVELRTGLMGRWQVVCKKPKVICDTGHNPGGWKYLAIQLSHSKYNKLHIVFGMAADKDVSSVLESLPKTANFYFTQASVKRAMECHELQVLALKHGIEGNSFSNVRDAYEAAQSVALPDDLIYIGGSSFIVADFLKFFTTKDLDK